MTPMNALYLAATEALVSFYPDTVQYSISYCISEAKHVYDRRPLRMIV
jgi:hypothetical protein